MSASQLGTSGPFVCVVIFFLHDVYNNIYSYLGKDEIGWGLGVGEINVK